MGFGLMDSVGASGLPARLKPVALVYARRHNDADGLNAVQVSTESIARYLSILPGTVRAHRLELARIGVLECRSILSKGRKFVRVMRFVKEALPPATPRYVDSAGSPEPALRTKRGGAMGVARPRYGRSTDDETRAMVCLPRTLYAL
jgi:hypothetical protein